MSSDGFNDLSDTRYKVTLLVHPTVPALLTSNGPLSAYNKRAILQNRKTCIKQAFLRVKIARKDCINPFGEKERYLTITQYAEKHPSKIAFLSALSHKQVRVFKWRKPI